MTGVVVFVVVVVVVVVVVDINIFITVVVVVGNLQFCSDVYFVVIVTVDIFVGN